MAWRTLTPEQREHKKLQQRQRRKYLRTMKQEQYRAEQDAKEAKMDACWKWDRALNGRQFETLVMKGER
jgi:hypothetical protein